MDTKTITIRYFKSYDFRASLATGVYGGLTSNGLINANFFTDRVIIPDIQTVDVNEDGITIGAMKEEKHGDIAREVQACILMDLNAAKIIAGWLETKIREHEELIKPNKK